MIKADDIIDNIIQRDTYFNSATSLAGFVLGYSVNGKKTLKTEDGITLAEYLTEK